MYDKDGETVSATDMRLGRTGMKTIVGLFERAQDVEKAVGTLQNEGLRHRAWSYCLAWKRFGGT